MVHHSPAPAWPPAAALDDGVPTVAAVMSRSVVSVDADATIGEARGLLAQHRIHHLLVLNQGRLVAVLSDRDVANHLSPFLGTLAEQTRDARTLLARAFKAATYKPVTIERHASVLDATALLLDHDISCLPVVDGDRVVGIVTARDLLRGLLACPLATPIEPSATP